MPSRIEPVVLENCRLLFRNFSGKEGRFAPEGRRTFSVALEHDQAAAMEAAGWNIKTLNARDEEDEPQPIIQVRVGFKGGRPIRIVLVTTRGKTQLTEDLVSILDWVEIIKADLIIRPYEWEVGEKSGVTAYLQSLFVTIREDPLELKYADLPDAPDSAISAQMLAAEDE